MDIPRGHAAMPLTETDFLDFIYNYFKAEYYPIRSFWSTATAFPRQTERWISMGHELSPLVVRPANAQAQKDLESLDYFTRKWNLDAGFVRGIVVRFAKYELHDRLEKRLYECARLDLMVRKALKEKHLIDALWPSPAPRNIVKELLQQGVQARQWYGDMFNKYFRVLQSIDSFQLRPEVDQHIKTSGKLMLIPFVDHLIFGAVDPIIPIVSRGAGYANAKGEDKNDRNTPGFGEPGKFEIRFHAPAEVTDTYTKSVVRQCQCMKCGTKRDVQVVISVDPNPNAGSSVGTPSTNRQRDTAPAHSKTAQRYSQGYQMPTQNDTAPPRRPPRPRAEPVEPETSHQPSTPDLKKQCPRCTFLNDPNLTACEMCEAPLPETTIQKPPTPTTNRKLPSHSHSASHPPPNIPRSREEALKQEQRPGAPNRHSLSASLFSIFPFSQQQQQEHHAKLPPTQQVDTSAAVHSSLGQERRSQEDPRTSSKEGKKPQPSPSTPPPAEPSNPRHNTTTTTTTTTTPSTPLSQHPEMAMMPLTPSPPSSSRPRPAPAGLPSNLMDDFVPVSPAFPRDEDDEDAGWGSMSREEARGQESSSDEEDGYEGGKGKKGMIDLDAVAREEADVWGDRDD